MTFRALLVLGFIVLWSCATGIGTAGVATSARATNLPQFNQVPCPHLQPDYLITHWRLADASRRSPIWTGAHVTTDRVTLARMKRIICSALLVHYANPIATNCPVAFGSATYHLAFRHAGALLLGATEQVEGCIVLTIDGHKDLGSLTGQLILPPGVPHPGATSPIHRSRP
jgi:hypothetical protein